MALNLYCGLPRSGKSYEVVSNVILPSIQQGRNVVTNIAGMSEQVMHDFLVAEGHDVSKLGKLKIVKADDFLTPNFFPTDNTNDFSDCFVQPGDLVAVDEIWRIWPTDKKVSEEHKNFFRMHGHFVNQDNGLTCEIALITQDPNDVHRFIRGIVMQTLVFEKTTELGVDTAYKIYVYSRTNTRKPLNVLGPYTYNKKYFPLYVSNSKNESGIKPREIRVEKRNSIFNSKLFKYFMPLAVFLFIGGIYGAWDFFHSDKLIAKKPTQEGDIKQINKTDPQDTIYYQNSNNNQNASQPSTPARVWRVAGLYGSKLDPRALLVDTDGNSKIVIPKTVSQYAEIISITTYTENTPYTSLPLPKNQGIF